MLEKLPLGFVAYLDKLERTGDLYLHHKAPKLPTPWKEFIIKILPWVSLVIIILAFPIILTIFGLGTLLLPTSFATGGLLDGIMHTIEFILIVGSLILMLAALPGLFKHKRSSWVYIFYALLLGVIDNLITLNFVGLIIGSLIPLYFLFQLRSYYTK